MSQELPQACFLKLLQQDSVALHPLTLIYSVLWPFSGKFCSCSGQRAQSGSRHSPSQLQVQTKEDLISDNLLSGPIGQARSIGFH